MTEMEFALNTFYLVLSGAFVMWMAAGFTMLEAGLVRSKNVSEIVTKNLGLYSIACVMYLACGFYLMYPGDDVINAYLPGMGTTWGISLAGLTANYDLGYSDAADFFFQVVFVATAMSIVSGAVAERMRLIPFFIFAVVMTGFIYPGPGYWKWGGGWLDAIGYTDFAGSGVVHLCGASAALGAFILWLGWFGFNGGSQLAVHTVDNANAVAQVFLNTNAAAAGGVLGAIIISKILTGKMDVTMGINGAIAGLVAITAAPDTPSGGLATIIGAIGGVIVYFSVIFFDSVLKVDDPVGAISAHGTVGVWGIMATPLSGAGAFGTQAIGAVSIFLWTFITAGATLLVIKAIMGLRPTLEDEMEGMDTSEVGVSAYPEFSE